MYFKAGLFRGNNLMAKVYFHVDLDAFFASVEQKEHPEYKGKPVIIGGIPGDRRAVVSTASYEARKYGVHSAMPLVQAVKLCPNGIFIRGNYHHYAEVSQQIMNIFHNYSPEVLQMSIDEAFIDMSGTERLFGPFEKTAMKLKQEVFEKTGLTVSVGISSSMYVAKIASGYRKPDGLTFIPEGDEEKFMLSLPLEKLWGAGTKTQERLKKCGLKTIQSIYEKSLNYLIAIFGENTGTFLYESVRGNKAMNFYREVKNHSISAETTFEFDLTDKDAIESALMELSLSVIMRMHKEKVRTRTVAVKIRYEDFTTFTVQETSEFPVANADDFFERCKRLFYKKYQDARGIRLLGVSADNVEKKDVPVQKELFDFGNEKKSKVEEAIFNFENKHPELKIRKARLIKKSK